MKNVQGFVLVIELSNNKKIELFYSSVKSSIDRLTSFFKDKEELKSIFENPCTMKKINETFNFVNINEESNIFIKDIYIENYRREKKVERLKILESKSRNVLYIYKNLDNLNKFAEFLSLPKYFKILVSYFKNEKSFYEINSLNNFEKYQKRIIDDILMYFNKIEETEDFSSLNLNEIKELFKIYLIDNYVYSTNTRVNYRNLCNLYIYLQENNVLDYEKDYHDKNDINFIDFNLSNIFNTDQSFIFDEFGNITYGNSIDKIKEPVKIIRKLFPLKERNLIFKEKIDYEDLEVWDDIESLLNNGSGLDETMYEVEPLLKKVLKNNTDREKWLSNYISNINKGE